MITKFPEDLLAALSDAPAVEPFEAGAFSPFRLFRLSGTSVLIHCIDFQTYSFFRQRADVSRFFQRLSERFSAEGLRVVHLWEDVWYQKPAVVLSRLRALAGFSERIPARLTQVRRIDRPTVARFLEENHLQVVTQSKYKYGLFLPGRYFRVLSPAFRPPLTPGPAELLVAVATFGYPRSVLRDGRPSRSVELVRFSGLRGCTVVGGLDKLLKAFIREHRPDDLMTYADRDWSDGRSYEKLGFVRQELTEPQTFWLRPGEWTRYYPHRLPDGLTEADFPARGYVPVYNAGSIKFVKML
ncbi:hypothetical protein [Larkinella soli]|uniref:hypothetical protein n=1 Tax=Larkinella soli TaxID=1770527 RepID=UPI000FFBEFA5|nr:hypothetical protein [Larkinella soli]